MSSFTIGVLGGMGPRATVYFEQKLLERFEGSDQSLPRIVAINDGAVPDRTAFLCGDGADPVPVLTRNAQALMRLGVDVVCMPCNTAHAALVLGRLLDRIQLPIIDMPAAALAQVQDAGCHDVLILGTEGTKQSGVYNLRAGHMRVTYPDQVSQQIITRVITETKSHGFLQINHDALVEIIADAHADAVILACTELSMLNQGIHAAQCVVDALEALIDACLARIADSHAITNSKE